MKYLFKNQYDCKYFFSDTAVIDETNYIYYPLSEFKQIMKKEIHDELQHQKNMEALQIKARDRFPYSLNEMTLIYLEEAKIISNKRIEFFKKLLARTSYKPGDKNDLNIDKAKERPISDFVEFNHAGYAECIFGHIDKTPSMYYYDKNKQVHCFSCGTTADVIDVVKIKFNLDFINAVKYILNK